MSDVSVAAAEAADRAAGVVVLAPPWPRSGSANHFAAQTAVHARRGARVLLLLTPLGRGFSRHKTGVWQDALEAMKFPGVETVTYARAGRGRVRSYLQWLRAGRDDAIAISARYAASGALPDELRELIGSADIGLIHVNHVYSMLLAQRVAALVQAAQGRRPRILLETHDIQSETVASGGRKNPHSHRRDAIGALLDTELALCAHADALLHVTAPDRDFFAERLPHKQHTVVFPTLHPSSEAELVRRRAVDHPAGGDFIYVATRHEANLTTLRWLLDEVLPLAGPEAAQRMRIAGAIGALLRSRDAALFERHAHLFVGEVPSVFDLYASARAVLAPARAGTGISIKLMEALCAGKPVLATTPALRGLPAEALQGADVHVHDTAVEFAGAMRRLAAVAAGGASAANAALYDRLFSNARYFADLSAVLEGTAPHCCNS